MSLRICMFVCVSQGRGTGEGSEEGRKGIGGDGELSGS